MPLRPMQWAWALQRPCCQRHDPVTAPSVLLVASALMHDASPTSCTSRMTYGQLVERTRLSRASVARAVASLTEAGWLIVTHSSHGAYGRGANVYVLTIPEQASQHRAESHGESHHETYPRSAESHHETRLREVIRSGGDTGRQAVDNVVTALGRGRAV